MERGEGEAACGQGTAAGMHGRGRRGPWPFRGAKIKPVDTEAPRTQRNLSVSLPRPVSNISLKHPPLLIVLEMPDFRISFVRVKSLLFAGESPGLF